MGWFGYIRYRTMSTSLQHIVGAGEGRAREESIEELFVRKDYAVFEVESLRRHPLFQSHDHFRFFLDILDEWNRKTAAQETPAHCDALFRRNAFLFNSLRSAALRPLPAATRSLAALFAWFTRARTARRPPSRPPAPAESDWHIRNTFKSNLPAE